MIEVVLFVILLLFLGVAVALNALTASKLKEEGSNELDVDQVKSEGKYPLISGLLVLITFLLIALSAGFYFMYSRGWFNHENYHQNALIVFSGLGVALFIGAISVSAISSYKASVGDTSGAQSFSKVSAIFSAVTLSFLGLFTLYIYMQSRVVEIPPTAEELKKYRERIDKPISKDDMNRRLLEEKLGVQKLVGLQDKYKSKRAQWKSLSEQALKDPTLIRRADSLGKEIDDLVSQINSSQKRLKNMQATFTDINAKAVPIMDDLLARERRPSSKKSDQKLENAKSKISEAQHDVLPKMTDLSVPDEELIPLIKNLEEAENNMKKIGEELEQNVQTLEMTKQAKQFALDANKEQLQKNLNLTLEERQTLSNKIDDMQQEILELNKEISIGEGKQREIAKTLRDNQKKSDLAIGAREAQEKLQSIPPTAVAPSSSDVKNKLQVLFAEFKKEPTPSPKKEIIRAQATKLLEDPETKNKLSAEEFMNFSTFFEHSTLPAVTVTTPPPNKPMTPGSPSFSFLDKSSSSTKGAVRRIPSKLREQPIPDPLSPTSSSMLSNISRAQQGLGPATTKAQQELEKNPPTKRVGFDLPKSTTGLDFGVQPGGEK